MRVTLHDPDFWSLDVKIVKWELGFRAQTSLELLELYNEGYLESGAGGATRNRFHHTCGSIVGGTENMVLIVPQTEPGITMYNPVK